MFLYESYCYADEQAVADSILSKIELANGGLIVSVDVIGTGTLELEYSLGGVQTFHTVQLAECDRLGFNNSFTGLTQEDATALLWKGVLVMVCAYACYELLRVLRA